MRAWKWIGLGIGIVSLAGVAAYAQYRDALEEPAYEIVESDGAMELRQYSPMIVAEVSHTGERRRALGAGFRRLAAYIFGQDRPGNGSDEEIAMTAPVLQDAPEKIAMTSPVLQDPDENGKWRTRFVMPGKYTLESLPAAPADIALTEVPSRKMAAIKFSGWGRSGDLAQYESELRQWIMAKEWKAAGPAEYAFYDPPMVPGPLRRNEVMIPIE